MKFYLEDFLKNHKPKLFSNHTRFYNLPKERIKNAKCLEDLISKRLLSKTHKRTLPPNWYK